MPDTKSDKRVEALQAEHDRQMLQLEEYHRPITEKLDLRLRLAELTGNPGDRITQAGVDLLKQSVEVQRVTVENAKTLLQLHHKKEMLEIKTQIDVEESLATLNAER